jgi:hypothetical protein
MKRMKWMTFSAWLLVLILGMSNTVCAINCATVPCHESSSTPPCHQHQKKTDVCQHQLPLADVAATVHFHCELAVIAPAAPAVRTAITGSRAVCAEILPASSLQLASFRILRV